MQETFHIRNEVESDYQRVEEITRKAFYNRYVPGCVEHYLVHIMRSHEDFIPELDLVIEAYGQIIGNIIYTKATLIEESGFEKSILTFGPVSILPEYQRRGFGKQLMETSFQRAIALGYDTIVISGSPSNYVNRGFQSCKRYHITLEDGSYPSAMLVKELIPGVLGDKHWIYRPSPVYEIDEQAAAYFDTLYPEKLEKQVLPCQEEFYILSHSTLS